MTTASNTQNGSRRPPAFTLVELLVVMAIIAILLTLGPPYIVQAMNASRLAGAGEKLLGSLSEAQQSAFSTNNPVEVRFYKYPGEFPGGPDQYHAYQFFRLSTPPGTNTEVFTKMGTLVRLPGGVVISSDSGLTAALEGASTGMDSGDVSDDKGDSGRPPGNAKYRAIRFMTDGTCRKVGAVEGGLTSLSFLTLPGSYITVVPDDGKVYTGGAPPKNFYCVQTDPYTGKSRSYRPGF
jgi:uncharacterized protein (TIGR02596 family)